MRALLAVICWLAGAGCSLIIDTESVRGLRDVGTEGLDVRSSVESDAGAVDGGGFSDVTAGVASPCGRAGASGLRCAAPVRLDDGREGLGFGSVAGMTDGFVVALLQSNAVVTRVLDRQGHLRSLVRTPSATRPTDVQASASGEHWAVAFVNGGGRQVRCESSVPTSRSSTIAPPAAVQELAVSIGPMGSVALGAIMPDDISTNLFRSVAFAPGCPSSGENTQPAYYVRGVAAMSVPGASPDAFRFGLTAVHPGLLNTVVAEVDSAGTRVQSHDIQGLGVWSIAVTPTSDGVHMIAAYGAFDASNTRFELWALAHRVDFGSPPGARRLLAPDIQSFDLDECGAGCRVAAHLVDEGRGRISAIFLSDDAELASLGTALGYDATCLPTGAGTEVDVAHSAGTLAFLVTQRSSANLYLCERPAFE